MAINSRCRVCIKLCRSFRIVAKKDEKPVAGIDELHQKVSAAAVADKRKGESFVIG